MHKCKKNKTIIIKIGHWLQSSLKQSIGGWAIFLHINWFLKGVNYLFNYMSLIIPGLVTTEFYTARYKVLHLYKYQAKISQKLTLLIATKSCISINTKQKYPKN